MQQLGLPRFLMRINFVMVLGCTHGDVNIMTLLGTMKKRPPSRRRVSFSGCLNPEIVFGVQFAIVLLLQCTLTLSKLFYEILQTIRFEKPNLVDWRLNKLTFTEEIHDYFSKFGDVESIKVKMNPQTGRSRGFAFVVFKDKSSVEEVSMLIHLVA